MWLASAVLPKRILNWSLTALLAALPCVLAGTAHAADEEESSEPAIVDVDAKASPKAAVSDESADDAVEHPKKTKHAKSKAKVKADKKPHKAEKGDKTKPQKGKVAQLKKDKDKDKKKKVQKPKPHDDKLLAKDEGHKAKPKDRVALSKGVAANDDASKDAAKPSKDDHETKKKPRRPLKRRQKKHDSE